MHILRTVPRNWAYTVLSKESMGMKEMANNIKNSNDIIYRSNKTKGH